MIKPDQTSLWSNMEAGSSRTILPLHNQVIQNLTKHWEQPKKVKPFDLEATGLFRINASHHEVYTAPRVADRFVALSVKGNSSDKVLSSANPKLLSKNFPATVAAASFADDGAHTLALKMANYQTLSSASCQNILSQVIESVTDPAIKEPLQTLSTGLCFMHNTRSLFYAEHQLLPSCTDTSVTKETVKVREIKSRFH